MAGPAGGRMAVRPCEGVRTPVMRLRLPHGAAQLWPGHYQGACVPSWVVTTVASSKREQSLLNTRTQERVGPVGEPQAPHHGSSLQRALFGALCVRLVNNASIRQSARQSQVLGSPLEPRVHTFSVLTLTAVMTLFLRMRHR